MPKVKDGFFKEYGILNNNYILLAAGGHIALGNALGNVPLSNQTLNIGLNADFLDGKHLNEIFTAFSGGTISSSANTLTQANHSITIGGVTKTAGSSTAKIINSLSISKLTSNATTNLTAGITINGVASADKTITDLYAREADKLDGKHLNELFETFIDGGQQKTIIEIGGVHKEVKVDADMLDGKHLNEIFELFSNAGSQTTRLTIGSVTKDLKIDADKLDGKHLNEIFTSFVNQGSQTTRLVIGGVTKDLKIDADKLDGKHLNEIFTAFSDGKITSDGNVMYQNAHSITIGGVTKTAGSSNAKIINSLSVSKLLSDMTNNLTLGITINGVASADKILKDLNARNSDKLDGKHLNELFEDFSDAGGQTTRIKIGGVTKDLKIDADKLDGKHIDELFEDFSDGAISSVGNDLTQANHSITIGGVTKKAGTSTTKIVNSLSVSKILSDMTNNLTLGITVNGVASADKILKDLNARNSDKLDNYHANQLFENFSDAGGQTTRIKIGGTQKDLKIDADKLDGKHLNEIFTDFKEGKIRSSGNTMYQSSHSITVGGVTKTAGDSNAPIINSLSVSKLLSTMSKNLTVGITVNGVVSADKELASLHADLLDGFHALGSADIANNKYIIKQAYFNIPSTTADNFYRIAVLNANPGSNNRDALFYTVDIITNKFWLYRVRHRGNSATDVIHRIEVLLTNSNPKDLRFYYGQYNQTGEIFLLQKTSSTSTKTIVTRVFLEGRRDIVSDNYIQLDSTVVTTKTYTTYEEGVEGSNAGGASHLSSYPFTAWGQEYWTNPGVPRTIDGDMTRVGNVTPISNAAHNLGSSVNRWKNIYGRNLQSDTHLYLDSSSSSHVILRVNNGTEVVRVASNQNVGIGITDPKYKLHIKGSEKIENGSLQIYPTGGSYNDGIRIHARSSDKTWAAITFCGSDNTGDTGITAKSWFVGNNEGNFYINRNSSNGANSSRLWGHGSGWVIGNTAVTNVGLVVEGTGNIRQIANGKYLRVGPQNATWAHYETDANTGHYFNKNVHVDGSIWRYNSNYGLSGGANGANGNFYARMIYANRDSASDHGGVSLYGTEEAYGIYFRGTASGSNWGKLGRVQSDWATYLTMSDTLQRGWIFRRGSTNVASIACGGEAFFSAVGKDNYIAYPQGATYSTQTGTVTGALAIYLPTAAYKCNTMLKFVVDIYDYDHRGSATYVISGYNYQSPSWINVQAYSRGGTNNGYANLTVRFGWDSTRNIVYIGETNTSWSYPQVIVRDVTLGFSNTDYNRWAYGWSIGFVTSFATVGTSVSNPAIGSGYWANLAIQASASNTTVPSFGAIRMNGVASAGTNYITGAAGRIYFGGNFHIDSLGGNATYINHYTANNVYLVTGGGRVGIGTASPEDKLHVVGNVRLTRGSKYFQLRQESDTWSSFYTNAAQYYFDHSIHVNGSIWRYNSNYGLSGGANGANGNFYARMIYANRDGSNSYGGVSLYSTDDNNYGIYFRGTASGSNWGKLGRVQGDWATYLTMDNSSQRGWIFRNQSIGPVASISNAGEAYFNSVGYNEFIAYPVGGIFRTTSDTYTGAIAILLPRAAFKSSSMLKFTIEIYNYVDNTSATYVVAGYNYSSPYWYNVTAYSIGYGDSGLNNLNVRFGHNGSQEVIWIGETNTTWHYPQVTVKDLCLGYSGRDYNRWANGWSINFVTSFNTVQRTISNTASNNLIVYQHTGNNTNYPVVWSNQNNTNSVYAKQLHKSWQHFYYNPALRRLSVGQLDLRPINGNYREGIRIYPNASWATIVLGGNDLTAESGTSPNSWNIHNNNGNFYINKNNSSGANAARLWGRAGGWTIGNTNNSTYRLEVESDSRVTGWSRAHNGFYVEGQGVHFTSQGSVGAIQMVSNNEFVWASSGSTLYFNYRATNRGTTVTNYIWNAGSSTSFATHSLQYIIGRSTPSSWLDGQRYTRAVVNIANAFDASSFWPIINWQSSTQNRWDTIGMLGNNLYFMSSLRTRTSNSYDIDAHLDITTGIWYSHGFNHMNYNSSAWLLRSDGGAANFNWSGQGGQPTWLWGGNSFNTYYVYNPANFNVNGANQLNITTGFRSSCLNYNQRSDSFDGNSGWSHYIVMNHGDGASYYHYNLAFPFWGPPMYKRQTGSTSSVTPWYRFATDENMTQMIIDWMPVGTILMWTQNSLPSSKWRWYTELNGRYPKGKSSGNLVTGGSNTHTLTLAQIPAHNHTWSGAHNHGTTSGQSHNHQHYIDGHGTGFQSHNHQHYIDGHGTGFQSNDHTHYLPQTNTSGHSNDHSHYLPQTTTSGQSHNHQHYIDGHATGGISHNHQHLVAGGTGYVSNDHSHYIPGAWSGFISANHQHYIDGHSTDSAGYHGHYLGGHFTDYNGNHTHYEDGNGNHSHYFTVLVGNQQYNYGTRYFTWNGATTWFYDEGANSGGNTRTGYMYESTGSGGYMAANKGWTNTAGYHNHYINYNGNHPHYIGGRSTDGNGSHSHYISGRWTGYVSSNHQHWWGDRQTGGISSNHFHYLYIWSGFVNQGHFHYVDGRWTGVNNQGHFHTIYARSTNGASANHYHVIYARSTNGVSANHFHYIDGRWTGTINQNHFHYIDGRWTGFVNQNHFHTVYNATISLTTSTSGSTQAHNNEPAYQEVRFILKIS